MNLHTRLSKLETQAPESAPIVVRVGFDETTGNYFPETPEQALARHGITPTNSTVIIFICYEAE